jgi:hypothetical protein
MIENAACIGKQEKICKFCWKNLHVFTVHQQYQSLYYPTNPLNYITRSLLKPVNV